MHYAWHNAYVNCALKYIYSNEVQQVRNPAESVMKALVSGKEVVGKKAPEYIGV